MEMDQVREGQGKMGDRGAESKGDREAVVGQREPGLVKRLRLR